MQQIPHMKAFSGLVLCCQYLTIVSYKIRQDPDLRNILLDRRSQEAQVLGD